MTGTPPHAVALVVSVLITVLASCSTGPTDPVPGPAAVSVTSPTHADIAYARASPSEVLDLWLPGDDRRPYPLVIFLHGGGFSGGDKSAVGPKVAPLLRAGLAVASVNYRLSGEATFPAAAQDAKAAVRHLRAGAATYGLDPGRFAVWGESAGANLAALVGTTGDQPTVLDDPALGNGAVSDAVQAVVDWYGPVDFAQRERQSRAGGSDCRTPQIARADRHMTGYLGADVDTVPRRAAESNPITYLRTAASLPAFSIAHGTADCLVPLAQSTLLVDALRAAGNRPDVHVRDGATHGDPRFDRELLAPTIAWLDGVLRR
ncbi:alpha/beta hydrolase [Pseudonocardia endophytica]|uniref:Acetyl esterase/lipase n=1 Tax=Pseudonocardia endophytica TaxID=401976 RepID=A0A4R1HMF8_PSEEN|nr:alpha/beta hydrolase [Pseudonocardia endophytica]TCK22223.1 acetyl esterase/lipase [Pseudonocardia endophytica]